MQPQSFYSDDRRWMAALACAFIGLLMVNPLGYIGGGWDDWQYLTAARCWVDHGPCLPRTHWEGRWPVFVPIAGLFQLFGESRTVLGLWPLAASIAAIAMVAYVGNLLFERPVGWVTALVLLVTPAFSIQILSPSVEAIELALVLGGAAFAVRWVSKRRWWLAFLSGLTFGLAFQVRETALIGAAFTAIYVIMKKPDVRSLAAAAIGFFIPALLELVTYWVWAGDPFLRRKLSLAHGQIPSSELLGPIDGNHPPFLNKSYIANWKHEPGIRLHWVFDPYLNLFVNGKAGFTLALTPILLWFGRDVIRLETRRAAWAVYALALLYSAVLIYVLAMDPKARIMFVPLTMVAIAFAMTIIAYWRAGRRLLPAVALGAHALIGSWGLWVHQRTDVIEGPAAEWIRRYPGEVMIDPNTKRHLALVPTASALPGLDGSKKYLLYNSSTRCTPFVSRSRLADYGVRVIEDVPISNFALLNWLSSGSLCLLRLTGQSEAELRRAIMRSRPDGRYILDGRIYLISGVHRSR